MRATAITEQTGFLPRSPLLSSPSGETGQVLRVQESPTCPYLHNSAYTLLPPPPFPCPPTHQTLLLGQVRFGPGERACPASEACREAAAERTPSSHVQGVVRGCPSTRDMLGKWTLPEEAITLEPDLADERGGGGEGGRERCIFGNSIITEEEQRAIDEVLVELQRAGKPWGDGGDEEEGETAWVEQHVLRFLYSSGFDVRKTTELMGSAVTFRRTRLPVFLDEVVREIRDEGMAYWHGRDRALRPLLIVRVQKMQQLQRPDRDIEDDPVTRAIIFCLEFFLRYLCVAGRVESWTVLCDCAGTSFSSFPLGLLLRLLKLFQASYRGRMHKFYLLNTPRFFQTLSRPLLSALPRSSARKLRVFGSFKEWSEERKQTYARHQLEVKYGGTQPDIEKDFFPFRFFPGPFDASTTADQVNWQSPAFLHEEVSPLIHTGFSLHASLYCRPNKPTSFSSAGASLSSRSSAACPSVPCIENRRTVRSCRASAAGASVAIVPRVWRDSEHTVLVGESCYSRFAFWASAASLLSLTPATAAWLNRQCRDKVLRQHGTPGCPRAPGRLFPSCSSPLFRPTVSLADLRALHLREKAQALLATDVAGEDTSLCLNEGENMCKDLPPTERSESLEPSLKETKRDLEEWRGRDPDEEERRRHGPDRGVLASCITPRPTPGAREEFEKSFVVAVEGPKQPVASAGWEKIPESPAAQQGSDMMAEATVFPRQSHVRRPKEGRVASSSEGSCAGLLDGKPEELADTAMASVKRSRPQTNDYRAEDERRPPPVESHRVHKPHSAADLVTPSEEPANVACLLTLSRSCKKVNVLESSAHAWMLSSSASTDSTGGSIVPSHVVMNSLCRLSSEYHRPSKLEVACGTLASFRSSREEGSLSHQASGGSLLPENEFCSRQTLMSQESQNRGRGITASRYFRRRVRPAAEHKHAETLASAPEVCARRRRVVLSPKPANVVGCSPGHFPTIALGRLSLQHAERSLDPPGCVEGLCVSEGRSRFHSPQLGMEGHNGIRSNLPCRTAFRVMDAARLNPAFLGYARAWTYSGGQALRQRGFSHSDAMCRGTATEWFVGSCAPSFRRGARSEQLRLPSFHLSASPPRDTSLPGEEQDLLGAAEALLPVFHRSGSSPERRLIFFDRRHGRFETGQAEEQESGCTYMSTNTQDSVEPRLSSADLPYRTGAEFDLSAGSSRSSGGEGRVALRTMLPQRRRTPRCTRLEEAAIEHHADRPASLLNHRDQAGVSKWRSTAWTDHRRDSLDGDDSIPENQSGTCRSVRSIAVGFFQPCEGSGRVGGHGGVPQADGRAVLPDGCIEVGHIQMHGQGLNCSASTRSLSLDAACCPVQDESPAARVMGGRLPSDNHASELNRRGFYWAFEELGYTESPPCCLHPAGEERIATRNWTRTAANEEDRCPGIPLGRCPAVAAPHTGPFGFGFYDFVLEKENGSTGTTSADSSSAVEKDSTKGNSTIISPLCATLRRVKHFRSPRQPYSGVADASWPPALTQESGRTKDPTEAGHPHYMRTGSARVVSVLSSWNRLRPWIRGRVQETPAAGEGLSSTEACEDRSPRAGSLRQYSKVDPVGSRHQLKHFFASCIRRSHGSRVAQTRSWSADSRAARMPPRECGSCNWYIPD